MIARLLIANRGEIACRIIETARRMGVHTIAVYSEADKRARHVALADQSVAIGPAPATESYLNIDVLLQAAKDTRADAIHPGYGFLSENPDFVDAVQAAELVFVGPSSKAIRAMGLKDAAKRKMVEAGVPVVPGYHGTDQDPERLAREAAQITYPVLIKARAGGGGKGMRLVNCEQDFSAALQSAVREAENAFGDSAVLIEKFIASPRHIEVQIFGDEHGNVVHLFERDCSLQRRHQKVIEEAPAPGMTDAVRDAMTAAAKAAARAINYSGAGTIEFIVDGSGPLSTEGFWFMEMNTRLQVEHPVTEAITGQDLVEWQLRVASGEPLPCTQQELAINGHAFEARLYAEDPDTDFLPAAGTLRHLSFGDARIDTGVREGDAVSPFYDPMIAKLTTHAHDRDTALLQLHHALEHTVVGGIVSNRAFLSSLARHASFAAGDFDTGLIDRDKDSLRVRRAVPESVLLSAAHTLLGLDAADRPLGFRVWGEASIIARLITTTGVCARRITVRSDGSVSSSDPDSEAPDKTLCTLSLQDLCDQVAATAQWLEGTTRSVAVLEDNLQYVIRRVDDLQSSDTEREEDGVIVAPMTGTVRVLDVKEGQPVSAGDRLLVMEAMKMETALVAPGAGVVEQVNCAVGDSVSDGQMLIQLELDQA